MMMTVIMKMMSNNVSLHPSPLSNMTQIDEFIFEKEMFQR